MSRKLLGALVTVLLGVFILTYASGGVAAPAHKSVNLRVNDLPLNTKGSLEDGTTMVPLRSLADELSFKVSVPYGHPEAGVVVTKGCKKLVFKHKSASALVNGHEIPLWPVASIANDGEMRVPVRFLLENMGYRVCWLNDPPNTVEIRPVLENNLVISTIRERLETATLSVDIQYPKILGLASTEVQERINAYFAQRVEGPKARAHEIERENAANGQYHLSTELVSNYIVNFNQNGILSITFDDYLYAGGAHGGTTRTGYTVNLETGKTYSLKDLFATGADYMPLLNDVVNDEIKTRGWDPITGFISVAPEQGFYIRDGDLVMYFQQYEIMPYAAGIPEFRVPMTFFSNILAAEIAAKVR